MKTVAIIPARGGSKGIPRKNVKMLAGKPLIHYPVAAAKNCKLIDKVIVSTENKEIADAAAHYGAEIINRPRKLAGGSVPTLPVLIHAVKEMEKQGYKPDIIILLYATAPFVKAEYIEDGIKKILKGCDSVVSVCEETRNYKLWDAKGKPMFKRRVNRQAVKKAYRENGAFYIMTYETIMKRKSITGRKTELIVMKPEESVDIDTPLDFVLAEALMSRKK